MRQARRVFLGGSALVIAGCAAASKAPPPRLLDGSRSVPPPAALRDLRGPLALGRMRAAPASAVDQNRLKTCVRRFAPLTGLPPESIVVERVGVAGATLTFRDSHAQVLDGCDAVAPRGRFCGGSAGLLRRGRLVDPRLDILCRGRRGSRIGFAWIEPAERARWIAVEQAGYTEVYRVAAGLPVRVTTSEVKVPESSAFFRIRQYAADGRELARETLEARVAG